MIKNLLNKSYMTCRSFLLVPNWIDSQIKPFQMNLLLKVLLFLYFGRTSYYFLGIAWQQYYDFILVPNYINNLSEVCPTYSNKDNFKGYGCFFTRGRLLGST